VDVTVGGWSRPEAADGGSQLAAGTHVSSFSGTGPPWLGYQTAAGLAVVPGGICVSVALSGGRCCAALALPAQVCE